MLEYLISSVDDQAVIRAWLKPVPACVAPASAQSRLPLPDDWTVTATSYDAWCGDVPLLPDGVASSYLIGWLKLVSETPAPRF